MLALVVICLTLPLQVVGAVAMPFCASGHGAGAAHSAGAGGDFQSGSAHHPAGAGHAGHGGHSAAAMDEDSGCGHHGCDQCGLCHLACASALPARATDVTVSCHAPQLATPAANVTFHIPDPLRRPPRTAAV